MYFSLCRYSCSNVLYLGSSCNRGPQESRAAWNYQAWTSLNFAYYSRSNQHPTKCWEDSWTWREHISYWLGWVSSTFIFLFLKLIIFFVFAAQLSDSKVVTFQLIGKDDSSFDDSEVLSGRWQFYVDAYVSVGDNPRFWQLWHELTVFFFFRLGRNYRWRITVSC